MNQAKELARKFCNLFLSFSRNEEEKEKRLGKFIKENIAPLDEKNLRSFFVFIQQNERTSPDDARMIKEFVEKELK